MMANELGDAFVLRRTPARETGSGGSRVKSASVGLLAMGCALIGAVAQPALATADESKWYSSFWPLGSAVPVVKLSEEYIPFEGKAAIPVRPELLIEAGDAFLDSGKCPSGDFMSRINRLSGAPS